MTIELVEALCGFQKIIKTLDDRDLVITVIPGNDPFNAIFICILVHKLTTVLMNAIAGIISGEIIKPGDVKCVIGEGMPHYKNPFEKGRLIIQFTVNFPNSLPPEVIPQLEICLPPR